LISIGIEELIASTPAWLKGQRLGLLCNQASVDRNFSHSIELLKKAYPGQLTCIFSPQHGFFAEKQDNMVESGHSDESGTGIPVFSLYSENRRPDQKMFALFDVLLIDLVDVGTRVYTFLYTMAYCLEAAELYRKKVIVLDRPNPIGGLQIEGNILEDDCSSFVGLFPLPMRHGLTFAELAMLINTEYSIGADLSVIRMKGWQREMYFRDTGQPWIFPSPNMPTPETALVYPGQVIWEGTNISEARGTTLPFELFGAPFVDCQKLMDFIEKKYILPGCRLRPILFEPTSNKWSGEQCNGFQIIVTSSEKFKPYFTSLALLQSIIALWPDRFEYKEPPYEYEYSRLPLDLILGSSRLRKELGEQKKLSELESGWMHGLLEFEQLRKNYFLYT
jgi:uncharacterized protein YbbC (DUF1343 family)